MSIIMINVLKQFKKPSLEMNIHINTKYTGTPFNTLNIFVY